MEIPGHLAVKVRREIRRAARDGSVNAAGRATRKRLGKLITQHRKAQGATVATAGQVSTVIAKLDQEVAASKAQHERDAERIKELEGRNEILQMELDSYRAYDAEMEDAAEAAPVPEHVPTGDTTSSSGTTDSSSGEEVAPQVGTTRGAGLRSRSPALAVFSGESSNEDSSSEE